MKIKKIGKKLAINKETVINLDNAELNNAVGGRTKYCSIRVSCPPCITDEYSCDPETCSLSY